MIIDGILKFVPYNFFCIASSLRYPLLHIEYAYVYFIRVRKYISIKHSNYPLIISCLCIVDKVFNDCPLKNSEFARNFSIKLMYLNQLELLIIKIMNYSFEISSSEWYGLKLIN
eukprot:NODE_73_length_23464_cov_0.600171.p11 type:complete len:114 gc:universal NODE_73_length_23464_cov_0.600171:8538-8197(-)